MDISKLSVIVRIEPSSRLSELCGFPYFIERRFKASELLEYGVINKDDISKMATGAEISKRIPVRD